MELLNSSVNSFTEQLASKAPVPGGGGASALVGAIGVALGDMVGELTVGKKKYADVEEDVKALMVKTHLSLSHEPTWKGVPKGWRLPIRDILEYGGAKFLCPMAGSISMMPGTGSNPAYHRVDVDTKTGKVSGLF